VTGGYFMFYMSAELASCIPRPSTLHVMNSGTLKTVPRLQEGRSTCCRLIAQSKIQMGKCGGHRVQPEPYTSQLSCTSARGRIGCVSCHRDSLHIFENLHHVILQSKSQEKIAQPMPLSENLAGESGLCNPLGRAQENQNCW
jgi:hypothetical protein